MITLDNRHLRIFSGDKVNKKVQSILHKFQTEHQFLSIFKFEDNLNKTLYLKQLINKINPKIHRVVLLGTGGSSLGAQVLCQFAENNSKYSIDFFDNIDPLTFDKFWKHVDLETTLFLIISKSGKTPETLTQALIAVERVAACVGYKNLADHFIIITEPTISPLKELSNQYNLTCIDHDPDIGGRFSALSLVGLFPALLMGVPVDQVIEGALKTFKEFLIQSENHPVTESVFLMYQIMLDDKLNHNVLISYIDQLEPFGRWFRQLWAESLGKNGLGSTPINAMGTVDQHSQLQLYLDGPKDKLFTVIKHPLNDVGDQVSQVMANKIGFAIMAGKTMAQLMDAEQEATIQVLKDHHCPVRVITLSKFSPENIGALMVQYMIETILFADLMGVNCFDQPAVESGKLLAKHVLNRNADTEKCQ